MIADGHAVPDAAQVAFLARLIDYAGLFPPASLPLAAAWEEYGRRRQGPAWWLLGRFLVPAGRLAALGEHASADFARSRRPFRLVVIGQPAASPRALVPAVAADLRQIETFWARGGPAVTMEAYETRLPAGTPAPVVAEVSRLLLAAGIRPYFELSPAEKWIGVMRRTVAALPSGAGFKLRCGGTAPAPPAVAIAATIDATRDAGVPLKVTAGLHHPFYRPDRGEHGFVNLFAAAMLADAHGLVESTVTTILTDKTAAHFGLAGDRLTWHEWAVNAAQIRARRRGHLVAFGSCDFEEPRDALAALGWLGDAFPKMTHSHPAL